MICSDCGWRSDDEGGIYHHALVAHDRLPNTTRPVIQRKGDLDDALWDIDTVTQFGVWAMHRPTGYRTFILHDEIVIPKDAA